MSDQWNIIEDDEDDEEPEYLENWDAWQEYLQAQGVRP